MDLSRCAVGAATRIVDVDVEPGMRRRLGELGLRPGAVVQVTQDVRRQGRVLAVGAERFALDVRTCTLIAVEPVGAGRAPVEQATAAQARVAQGARA